MPRHHIYCQMTGVQLATLELLDPIAASCASLNWQAEWRHMCVEHPLFSLTPVSCLRTARIKFRQLAANWATADRDPLEPEVVSARVAFVAVLRNMGCLVRKEPNANPIRILPAPATVLAHGQALLELAYWYATAQSVKFKFPALNVARINANSELMDIGAFIGLCRELRNKWLETETRRLETQALRDNDSEAFIGAAKKAEARVIGGSARRLPRASLWNWLSAAIATEDASFYERWQKQEGDAAFFKTMFFTTDTGLKRYSVDDVDALEDILLRFAPLGTTPFFAFRTELNRMKQVIQRANKSFTVDWMTLTVGNSGIKQATSGMTPEGAFIASEDDKRARELAAGPTPERGDYPDQVSFIRAKANWALARTRIAALDTAAARKQVF